MNNNNNNRIDDFIVTAKFRGASIIFVILIFLTTSISHQASGYAVPTETQSYVYQGMEHVQKSYILKIENKTYPISYYMHNGGSIVSMHANASKSSVAMIVTSPQGGYLDLIFPRDLYDDLLFTNYYRPGVSIDGYFPTEAQILDDSTSCDRISLRISIDKGSEQVVIAAPGIIVSDVNEHPPRLVLEKPVMVDGQEFMLGFLTDAVKCDISFAKEEKKIHVDIEGTAENNGGYFSVTLPHKFLGGKYTVLVDGRQTGYSEKIISPAVTEMDMDATRRGGADGTGGNNEWSEISFNYTRGAESIDIIGTTAIPEFGSVPALIAGLAVISGMVARAAVVIDNRR